MIEKQEQVLRILADAKRETEEMIIKSEGKSKEELSYEMDVCCLLLIQKLDMLVSWKWARDKFFK